MQWDDHFKFQDQMGQVNNWLKEQKGFLLDKSYLFALQMNQTYAFNFQMQTWVETHLRFPSRPWQPAEEGRPFLGSALWCSTGTGRRCPRSPASSPPTWWMSHSRHHQRYYCLTPKDTKHSTVKPKKKKKGHEGIPTRQSDTATI